ncbi:interferon lambda-4-like [Panthera uncia]|uniref:interferon lambda-4-like n=1 Tax=Panthera uncia TaxID=29064 RepID=UPI0020FF8F12|nr:interferon lambda-4-like [Panthera uncia]
MGPRGAAAVAVGLWVLVTAGEAADPGVTTPRRCLLSHYRSLDPRAVAAVKALRDRYVSDAQTSPPVPEGPLRPSAQQESPPSQRLGSAARRLSLTPTLVPQEEETLSWRPRNCSFRPRRDPPRPWSCARLRLVARGLEDAQAVLSRLRSPERFPGIGPILELLAAARRDVGACLELVRPGSWRKSLRPPRTRPQTRRADSPGCHEASVVFNLLRLLTWDLRLVADSGPCL